MGWRTSERKGDRTLGKEGRERRPDARKRRWRKETGRSEEKVEKGDRTLGKEGREREIGRSEVTTGEIALQFLRSQRSEVLGLSLRMGSRKRR
jgi:hypothetical protein